MRRRDFIVMLSSALAIWPLWARAQQSKKAVIGILETRRASEAGDIIDGLRQDLRDAGYVDGKNIAIESYYGDTLERLHALATDLARQQVAVIFVPGAAAAALAARDATTAIPIVFAIGGNPVELGLVKSLSRPGGNITGVANQNAELDAKRLGLIAEAMPEAAVIGFLVNPHSPTTADKIERVQAAARTLHRKIEILSAATDGDIDDALIAVGQHGIQALMVAGDNFFGGQSRKIAALTSKLSVPVIGPIRDIPVDGGLMSYGPSMRDAFRLAAIYIARILGGEKPSDLPVVQPTKFDFVINLKTAKTFALVIPPGLLAIADEVIE